MRTETPGLHQGLNRNIKNASGLPVGIHRFIKYDQEMVIHYNAPGRIVELGNEGLRVVDRKGGIDPGENTIDLLLAKGAVMGVPGNVIGSALGFSTELYFSPCRLMYKSGTGNQQHT